MSIANLQQLIGVMTGNDPRAVGSSMMEAHKTTTAMLEKMAIALDVVNRTMDSKLVMASGRKPLSESRCVNSLKTLGSDKLEFKNWNEKFINATSQTFGMHWRTFMNT